MKNVLVIGSVNIDLFVFGKRVPIPGESILMDSFSKAIGGKGLNQALALKNQGVNTRFQCCIGDDAFSTEIKQFLDTKGFHDTLIKNNSNSGVVFIGIDDQGQNTMMICPNSNLKMTIDDIPIKTIEWADIIVLQQEIDLETIRRILSLAKKLGKTTVFNAAPANSIDYLNCSDVDYLIVNEQEFASILNITSFSNDLIEQYFKKIYQMGFQNIVFTNGANGVYLYHKNQVYFLNSHKVKVLNTVGAGDTFIGVWVASMIRYNDPLLSLKYANAAAALMISQKQATSETKLTEQMIVDFINHVESGENDE